MATVPSTAGRAVPPAGQASAGAPSEKAAPVTRAEAVPKTAALPRPVDGYEGPYPAPAPAPDQSRLERRINALLPALVAQVEPTLAARTGWTQPLAQLQVELVDRAGMRATLRNQEGYGTAVAFLLSWILPIAYAPGLGRVLVVAPTAKRYTDATLKFQLARALCGGAVASKHPTFYDHIARRLISARPRSRDIYACRAWAGALGESVANAVAPAGRKGPWWQRLAIFCMWPFARYLVGPQRLARRFVPILESLARGKQAGLVDRMLTIPPLCSVLYSEPGRRLLVVDHTPSYKRAQLRADVVHLRQYNAQAGATAFTAEL